MEMIFTLARETKNFFVYSQQPGINKLYIPLDTFDVAPRMITVTVRSNNDA